MTKTILYKAEDRFITKNSWLTSYHSFNFNNFYRPDLEGFGVLRVLNDDTIKAGAGFGTHGHANMEIITIMLEGTLEHKDSMGHTQLLHAGEVQVMTAGSGIMHSEHNHSKKETAKLLQIWIDPKIQNLVPRYEQEKIDLHKLRNDLHKIVACHKAGNELFINQDATLFLGHFDKDQVIHHNVINKHRVYLFMIKGEAIIEKNNLKEKDALGISETKRIEIDAKKDSQILLIEVPMK